MSRRRVWAVVPARYDATRLPGKPLALLSGIPMVEHVRRRAVASALFERVVVATDDDRVVEAVRASGGEVVKTGPCPSGTHRVEAALSLLGGAPDLVVNVQGDQPLLPREHLVRIVAAPLGDLEVGTLCAPLVGDPADPSVVKLVRSGRRVLYFSRAAIPSGGPFEQHVGLYAFTPRSLALACSAPRSSLCLSEDLEQLAWLEAGAIIVVDRVESPAIGVDDEAGLERARRALGAVDVGAGAP